MKFSIKVILLAISLATAPTASAWWNDDWGFRRQVAFDTSPAGVPLDARIADTPVLVRLTIANFPYFSDLQPDGRDIRFVASDDQTPLKFHIQTIDTTAGVANIWVRVPALDPGLGPDDGQFVYLYYGNATAPPASDAATTWDAATTLVLHLDEALGPPKDSSAYAHGIPQASGSAGVPGQVDAALGLGEDEGVRLAANPALGVSGDGATLSAWLRPDGVVPRGNVVEITGEDRRLALELRDGFLTGVLTTDGNETLEVRTPAPLAERRWQHVALSAGPELVLYVDGLPLARRSLDRAPAPFGGEFAIGATSTLGSFSGSIDEVQLARLVRPPGWMRLAAASQGADTTLLAFGSDESRDADSNGKFQLVYTLLNAVDITGWIVIALLVGMAALSFDVLITKGLEVARTQRDDATFLAAFEDGFRRAGGRVADITLGGDTAHPRSSLAPLFRRAQDELQGLLDTMGRDGGLSLEALEVVRSTLNTAIVEATNRLNARLVFVTLAISGGPFFGLLGTVIGVMMTFAAIAAQGDVNVRTIAPGVAAALTTTVMGLIVAIPSLFGYNWVAGRVAQRISAMEVFADQFISRVALAHAGTRRDAEPLEQDLAA